MTPRWSKWRGETELSHLPPTSSSLPGLPLVRDPLDARYTDVLPSTIPGAGEGLFARKDVEAFTIVSVFSGLTMSKQEYMERATSIASNQSRSGTALTVTFPEQRPRQGTESGPGCSELVTPNAIGLDPGQVILKLTQAKLSAWPGGGHPLQRGVHRLQWAQGKP